MATLRELLQTEDVRKKLMEASTKTLEAVGSCMDLSLLRDVHRDDPSCYDLNVELYAFYLANLREWHEQVLYESIISKLDRPIACTLEELLQDLREHLIDADGITDGNYRRFSDHVLRRITDAHTSDPIVVATGRFSPLGKDASYDVWAGHSGFRVRMVACAPRELCSPAYPFWMDAPNGIGVVATGQCSPGAWERFTSEIASVTRSLFHTAYLLFWEEKKQKYPVDPVLGLLGPDTFAIFEDGALHKSFSFIPKWLEAYFADSPKKDSMGRRIRNAVHLLVESDRQEHGAIALAMSVAAMEALVCTKGSDLAKMLAQHAARFLEPNLVDRANAEKVIKTLYGARSDVLHGTIVEREATLRMDARLLAAGLLRAVHEWHSIMYRVEGRVEKPDALLKALQGQSKYTAGLLDGVTESPVRKLWRSDMANV